MIKLERRIATYSSKYYPAKDKLPPCIKVKILKDFYKLWESNRRLIMDEVLSYMESRYKDTCIKYLSNGFELPLFEQEGAISDAETNKLGFAIESLVGNMLAKAYESTTKCDEVIIRTGMDTDQASVFAVEYKSSADSELKKCFDRPNLDLGSTSYTKSKEDLERAYQAARDKVIEARLGYSKSETSDEE